MATLKLYLDTRSKRADGTSCLRIAVNNHGGTAFISLYQYIKPDEWDKRTCKVKKRPDKDALNNFLMDRLGFFNRMLMQAQCRESYRGDMSAIELREAIMREAEPKDTRTKLADVFDRYKSRDMRDNTKRGYEATWKLLTRFDKGVEKIKLEEVNRDWLERFISFMSELGLKHNTKTTHLRHLSAVFNYAIDCELTTNFPFRRLDLSMEQTEKRDLKLDELRAIFNADVPFKRRKFLDAFKLMFFLIGINMHDLYNLTEENIVDGRLEYKRLKTNKNYSIKLQPEALEIINKYKGRRLLLSFCEEKSDYRTFGVAINSFLGEMQKGVTTYYARHTWATLAFKLGISKDTISLALGHSFGVRVTDTYINVDLSRVDAANRKVIDYVLYDKK